MWLVDGVLQLQRQMFTSNFANDVIAPVGQGQPRFVSGPVHWAVQTILLHPAIFDACFALVQLGLGILILWKRTAKYGLMASVLWGLAVWYLGEGLGGLANGQTSLLMGMPGAALLYAIIALGVMPPKTDKGPEAKRPAPWLAIAWAALWLGGALLQLVSGQNTTADLSSMISGMADGAPGWLAGLDLHVANFLRAQGNWVIAALVIVQALIGFLVLLPRRTRTAAVGAGILLSLGFWAVGQSFGTYYSGLATDPNSAPLFILLGLAVFGSKRIDLNVV